MVSHQTALAVHDLGDVMPSRIHLTVPHGFRARSPAVVLHTRDIDPADVELREGYRVTSPARSILDAAVAGLEIDQLRRVIRDALDRGLVSAHQLRSRASSLGLPASQAIGRALGTVRK